MGKAGGRGRLRGFANATRSEWTKIRTVGSTLWSLVVTVGLVVGIGGFEAGVQASHWSRAASPASRARFDPTVSSLVGLLLGQLSIGVLGVLVMSAEFDTGSIRTTFTAVPKRTLVIAAKAAVVALVELAVGELAAFGAFLLGQSLLSGRAPHANLGQPEVLRAVFSGGLYLAILGLLAFGLAVILRHTAGAIASFVGLVFVLPGIVAYLPTTIENALDRYLPVNIWAVVVAVRPGRLVDFGTPGTGVPRSTLFGPWTGLAVLAGYAAVALVIGGWLTARRDA